MGKIDLAYCSVTGKYIDVESLIQVERQRPLEYATMYKGELYCQECKKALVTLVHRERPFFRTYPDDCHEDGCNLAQEEMEKEEVSALITKERNFAEVDRQLNRVFSTKQ